MGACMTFLTTHKAPFTRCVHVKQPSSVSAPISALERLLPGSTTAPATMLQLSRSQALNAAGSCKCSTSAVRPPRLAQAQHQRFSTASSSPASQGQASSSTRSSTRVFAGDVKAVKPQRYIVEDIMTTGHLYTCRPDDTIDDALELLVTHRITGLPVVNESGMVVGVVSDYDLLALDALGKLKDDRALFPEADQTWQAFTEVKTLLAKTGGKRVKDVMTNKPITVRVNTDLDVAARLLLQKKIHRLPVVDENGSLVGVLSRGNLIKAALAMRKAARASAEA